MSIPIAPINPAGAFPPLAFDQIIQAFGINVLWYQSHVCPCNGDTGSPNPNCDVCFGKAYYYDPYQGPFITLLTLVSWIGRSVAIGEVVDPSFGMIYEGHPILTVSQTFTPVLWENLNTFDLILQTNTNERFQAVLRVGQNETVPAWHFIDTITIPTTGAVVVEDPTINQPVSGVAYTVNGGTVTLNPNAQYPNGYPEGTSYSVEYFSPVVWSVSERVGGLTHQRPFVQGLAYPRRVKLSLWDLFLRSPTGSSTLIGNNSS